MTPITPEVFARVCCAQFIVLLTPRQLLEIARGAKEPGDCCDDNMVMADAFKHAAGRDMWLPSDAEAGDCSEAAVDRDFALWNAAVDVMRAERFWLPDARTVGDEQALCDLLGLWCGLQGLDRGSADDMLADLSEDGTPEQCGWLQDYIEVWDEAMDA